MQCKSGGKKHGNKKNISIGSQVTYLKHIEMIQKHLLASSFKLNLYSCLKMGKQWGVN